MTTMKDIRFGIEIETVGLVRTQLAIAIATAIPGSRANYEDVDMPDGRRWRVVRDGSLPEVSGEIVSPILTWTDLPLLQDVVRGLRAAGAKVDASCGIHIHVDGTQHFTPRALANLAKTYNKQEELLHKALKVSQHRINRFCRPLDERFVRELDRRSTTSNEQIRRAWYGYENRRADRYDSSRYHGLNLNSYFYRGTIEFRLFNGTLHAGEIKAYVHLCLAMAAKACTSKSAVSKKRETSAATAKYDFRVFLLRLGMIGDEFESTRLHLLKHLQGSSAFRAAVSTQEVVAPPPFA